MWVLFFVVTTAATPMTGVYAPDNEPHQFKTLKECLDKGKEIGDEIHEAIPSLSFDAECRKVPEGDKVQA